MPVRHHHTIAQPGADATLLLMPAWTEDGERFIGCKIVTVFPDNAKAQRPSVYGQYLLLSGETGEPLAMIDGRALTAWRTACASALAARYLAREDASHLVMVGAGALAPHLIRAHASVRPITRVTLWNRTQSARGVARLRRRGRRHRGRYRRQTWRRRCARPTSCPARRLSAEPLIKGAWLKKGAHLDLVGGFTPKMREADDRGGQARAHLRRYARGRAKEAGDIVGAAEEEDHRCEGDHRAICSTSAAAR